MITLYKNNQFIPVDNFLFPSGEIGVKIKDTESTAFIAKTGRWKKGGEWKIVARLTSANDILLLVMLVDAARRLENTPVHLVMPKVPFAQQDRVCSLGESLSLRVFADIINAQKFTTVTVLDPHSDVVESVFDNLCIKTQLDVIAKWSEFIAASMGSILVSPDSGANKKTAKIAKFFGHDSFIRGDKLRELSTGKIIETIVHCDDLGGRDVVIIDDICLGGATFVALAEALKKKKCGNIDLFVTHGVFSAGINRLLESGIRKIWTTNSFSTTIENVGLPSLSVFPIEKIL